MDELTRYSLIKTKIPREFLLLQGKGCVWKKCTFCDYYEDITSDPFKINRPVLEKITGETGVLDIINSGSAMELDYKTIAIIQQKIEEYDIHTVWFEAHWIYKDKLSEFAKKFKPAKVKFRIGAETFNPDLRNSWNKGIPSNITAKEMSKYFDGCCLLVGVKGQSKETILNDIQTANDNFEYFSINVFIENSTALKRDNEIIKWFVSSVFPKIKDNPKIEILINNTDLGVG